MINNIFSSYHNPPERPVVLQAMVADLQNPSGFRRLAISPFSTVLNWVEFFSGELIFPLKEYKLLVGRVDVISSILGLPNRFQKLIKKVTEWKDAIFEGISWEVGAKTTDVYVETSGTVSLFADGVKLGRDAGLYTLTSLQSKVIGFIGLLGSISLFLTSIRGIVKHTPNFWNEDIGSVEFNFALMELVGKVLLVALSIIGIGTFLYGNLAGRVILLSISTMILILSIASHYYEKVYVKQGLKNSS